MTKVNYARGVRVTGVRFDEIEIISSLYVYQVYQDGFESNPLAYYKSISQARIGI
jgi:hypothetical protein